MDRDDLELFTRSLRHATEQHTGAELDGALAELGWSEAHDADPEAAVSVLFELQGSSCASSAAIEQVLRSALGLSAEGSVLLPALSGWSTPGRLEIGSAHVLTPVTNAHLVCRLLLEKKTAPRLHSHN